jgi:hypothetical protein
MSAQSPRCRTFLSFSSICPAANNRYQYMQTQGQSITWVASGNAEYPHPGSHCAGLLQRTTRLESVHPGFGASRPPSFRINYSCPEVVRDSLHAGVEVAAVLPVTRGPQCRQLRTVFSVFRGDAGLVETDDHAGCRPGAVALPWRPPRSDRRVRLGRD